MAAFVLVAILGLAAATASAAPRRAATPQLIDRDAREGRIDRDTATLYLAYALGRPEKLPSAYRSNTPWDGTLPLRHLRDSISQMKPGPRRDAAGEVVTAAAATGCDTSNGSLANETQSTHFYVQYGTVGGGLTVTSYVNSLEGAWTKEVSSFGWAAPPTPAPGGRYHVRIDSLGSGLYGYVSPSGTYAGPVGDNPSTAWNEGDAYATCMVLNSDFSGFPSPPQASLDSTTAHEFNHSIQFGYGALTGSNAPDDDFVEGGATWMEDEVYDSANDNLGYLWPVFEDSMGDYDASPYAYWITFRGLTERYGTGAVDGAEQVMQDFWEATSKNTGNNLTAMQGALANRGTTLADAFHAHAIAVKFNRACGGGYAYPYCFEEGPAYVAAAGPTAVHETIASVGGSTSGASVEDNYAINWVAIPPAGGPYDVTLHNTSAGGQLRGTVACDTGTTLVRLPLPVVVGAGDSTTLGGFNPTGCAGTPVLAITNQAQTAPNPTSSTARSYQVSTAASGSVTLSVSKGGSGAGTVTSVPAGISCGTDCSESYAPDSTVTLTAVPSAGSVFSGWSGACAGSAATCVVTMSAARSVTASFVALSSPITPITPTSPVITAIVDRTPPLQGALRLSAATFRAARSGPSARAAAGLGTRVRYFLSEPGSTRFRVERAVRGRRVGGRCVRTTRANAGNRPCTRYVLMRGSFSRRATAGTNRFRFTGRLSGRALKPGRYRLVARSTDAAGNRSSLGRVRFRIAR